MGRSVSSTLHKTLLSLAVAVTVLLGILGIGALAFSYYLEELYPPPPPEQPELLPAPLAKKVDRVVLFVIDAAREDLLNDARAMPHTARLAERGRRGVAITQPVTMTLLSVLNFGTGMSPGLAWSVHNFQADTFADESLFYWAHAYGLGVAFTGDAAWAQLFGRWATFDATFPEGGLYAEKEGLLSHADRDAFTAFLQALAEPEAYPIAVYHATSPDHQGHKTGALTWDPHTGDLTPYAQTAQAVDHLLGQAFDRYYRPGDLWVITADHGMTDDGNHGGGDAVTRRAPFVLVGEAVVPGPPHEMALNAFAPTLALALGLPVPRTAEVPAAFALLDFTPHEVEAALAAHAERRQDFVLGVVTQLGLEAKTEAPHLALHGAGEHQAAIQAANNYLQEIRVHRRWLQLLAMGVGLALHLLLALLLLAPQRLPAWLRPTEANALPTQLSAPAVALWVGLWLVLISLPLVFDHWLFRMVAILGQATQGYWYIGRLFVYAGLIGGPLYLAWRLLRPRLAPTTRAALAHAGPWLIFVLFTVAVSQIVLKWPYGPLGQTYLMLFALLALALLPSAWRHHHRWHWLASAAAIAAMWGLFHGFDGSNLQLLTESTTSRNLAWIGVIAAFAFLSATAARGSHRKNDLKWMALMQAPVLAAAFLYRLVPQPTMAYVALLLLALAALALGTAPRRGALLRNGVLVLALGVSHVMSSDWVVLMLLPFVLLAWSLAQGSWLRRSPVLSGALVALLSVAYFYLNGYRFAFPEMDVRVAFMLDQSQINLVQGFFLFALQHSPIWLLLWAILVETPQPGRRPSPSQLPQTILAVAVVFLVRCWGPFFSIEFKLENHWFISHAIPMFILSMVEMGVALAVLAFVGLAFRARAGQGGAALEARWDEGAPRKAVRSPL